MSFKFKWPTFSEEFHGHTSQLLETALNKGDQRPGHICDDIHVRELHMGTQPPDLDMIEIGELSLDRFRGTFRLTYAGDAFLVLQTKVQVNPVTPMHQSHDDYHTISTLPSFHHHHGMHAAQKPLVVPMLLRISHLKLRGIITLVVDKSKGVTLSFKNDPLEHVHVNSTFDELASVKKMLQSEIEKQLGFLFSQELPRIVHELSLKYMGIEEPSVEDVLRRSSSARASTEEKASSMNASSESVDSAIGSSIQLSSTTTAVADSSAAKNLDMLSAQFRQANIDNDDRCSPLRMLPDPRPLSSARTSPEKQGQEQSGVGGSLTSLATSSAPRTMLFSSLPVLPRSPLSPVKKQNPPMALRHSAEERPSSSVPHLPRQPVFVPSINSSSASLPSSPSMQRRSDPAAAQPQRPISPVGFSTVITPETAASNVRRQSRIIHASLPSIRTRHFDALSDIGPSSYHRTTGRSRRTSVSSHAQSEAAGTSMPKRNRDILDESKRRHFVMMPHKRS